MIIRHETPADAAAVRSVVSAAFGSSLEADLVEALRPLGGDRFSFVAERDGAVVGHVMCTPSLLDAPERLVDVLTLAPLAVAPEHQRTGVGRALVAGVLRSAVEAGYPLVFLEGDWRYYGRLGFRRGDELGFRAPSLRIPAPAFQVAVLAGHEPWMTGTLVYPEAIWRLDCVGLRGDDLAQVLLRPDAR